jgi:hypothetical protein
MQAYPDTRLKRVLTKASGGLVARAIHDLEPETSADVAELEHDDPTILYI